MYRRGIGPLLRPPCCSFPRMRQYAHRTRQTKQTARKGSRKAELSVDHRRRTVDVHRDAPALLAPEQLLDQVRGAGELARDDSFSASRVDQLEQPRRAWVDRMEPMAEAGN